MGRRDRGADHPNGDLVTTPADRLAHYRAAADAGPTVTILVERTAGIVEAIHVPRRTFDLMAGPAPPPEFISNGMGPRLGGGRCGRLLTWLVPDSLGAWDFLLAAHFHDYAYEQGGGIRARRRGDFGFARNIATSISETRTTYSAPLVFAVALLCWFGVRAGGWAAWNYRRRLRAREAAFFRDHPDGVMRIPCAEIPRPRGPVMAAVRLPWAATRLAWWMARGPEA